MAKMSKTQRAKASAKRAAKKEAAQNQPVETAEEKESSEEVKAAKAQDTKAKKDSAKETKKKEAPKKQHFQFLKDVRAELKRVTWPTKKDVFQWSGVVVAALLFFGIFVYLLDNFVVTPSLIGVSSIEIEGVTPQSESEIRAAQATATVQTSDGSTNSAQGGQQ